IDVALDPSTDNIDTSERHLIAPRCVRQNIYQERSGNPPAAISPAGFVFGARIKCSCPATLVEIPFSTFLPPPPPPAFRGFPITIGRLCQRLSGYSQANCQSSKEHHPAAVADQGARQT